MIKDYLTSCVQNKNFIMFVTAIIYMLGVTAYFNNFGITAAAIISVAAIIAFVKKAVSVKYILFAVFIFYFGFFNSYFRIPNTDALLPLAPSDTQLTGQIVSIPNSTRFDKTQFFFAVTKAGNETVKAKTLVTVNNKYGDFDNFNIGDYYKINAKLRAPFKVGNPSQFDYGKYLRNFNTFTVSYAEKSDCTEIPDKLSTKWKFLQGLNDVRNRILNTHALYLKSPNLEILGGIVFGDDAVAPPDYIKASFINSGLLHILAASGMNVAFIYGFWFFFMRKLRMPFKLTVISGMGVIILYTLMTGLGPSVIRAALMLLFILAGKLIDRDANSVSLLAFVALLMLIYNPAYINDVGFQLSFIVTFGLLTTANAVFERTYKSKIPSWALSAVLIPIIAQIWVAPIQMFYFNTFSTYSILANVAIMPFLSIISFGGFVSSVLAIFTPIAKYVCFIADFLLKYLLDVLVYISDYFSNLPNSLLVMPHPSIIQILLYYSIIMLFTLMLKIGWNKKIITSIGAVTLILIASTISLPNKNLEIITFDVQNADSFLIRTPKNKYFMIDTGKSSYTSGKSQAQYIMLKYLKDRNIKKLEGLIITHFDNDHAGGAADILSQIKTNNLYVNSYSEKSMTAKKIYETALFKETHSNLAKNNHKIYTEDNLSIKTYYANSDIENENSIITLVQYKDFDMLFMGDAGIEAFQIIQKDLPNNVEILKVGHHGANNVVNRQMLNYLKNDISIISTGLNRFGHPTAGTLDILRETSVYRTDRQNSIKIITDGNKYQVLTFDRDRKKYIEQEVKQAASTLRALPQSHQ